MQKQTRSNQTIQQIDRDRRHRERELALLMLLLAMQVRRYATHAIRLGTDPLAAMRLVWLGGEHFRGITNPLARAMADAHLGGFTEAARLSESTAVAIDAKLLAKLYEPLAEQAAVQMLGTMQEKVATAQIGVYDSKLRIQNLRTAFEEYGYYKADPWAIKRAAEANILSSYSNGMAQGFRNGLHTGYRHVSILDDGTTPICNERDGLKLPKEDAFWTRNYPPLHFNCRSILLPLRGAQVWSDRYPQVPPSPGWGFWPTLIAPVEQYPKAA